MQVHMIHFDTLDSTNTWGKANATSLDPQKMTCILADRQTAGHGTFGKKWVSQKGNLHMSLFYCLEPYQPLPAYMAQLFSYSAAQVLLRQGIAVQIKWPNDLLVGGKKLSGVIVETVQIGPRLGVVMGLGMNVNTPVQADQPTTSLIELTGHPWDISSLCNQIIDQFQIDRLLDHESFQKNFEKLLIAGAKINRG